MNFSWKRFLSMVLAVVMVVGMVPFNALRVFADELADGSTNPDTNQTSNETSEPTTEPTVDPAVAAVQALIDALPTTVTTEEEALALEAQIAAVDDAMAELTTEQAYQLDYINYVDALDALASYAGQDYSQEALVSAVVEGNLEILDGKVTESELAGHVSGSNYATRYSIDDGSTTTLLWSGLGQSNDTIDLTNHHDKRIKLETYTSSAWAEAGVYTIKVYHEVTASLAADSNANAIGGGVGVTNDGKIYHNEDAAITVTDVDGFKAELYNGTTLVATLNDENGWTYTVSGVTASAAYTVKYVSTEAAEYNVTVNVVNGEYGTAVLSKDKGIEGDAIVVNVSPLANTNSTKYTYEITVDGEGAAVSGNTVTVGTSDVTVTVTFATRQLVGRDNEVKYDPMKTIQEQLDTLKAEIFNKVVVNSVPAGVTLDQVTIEYYPYFEERGSLTGSLNDSGYYDTALALDQTEPEKTSTFYKTTYSAFGARVDDENNSEKIKITWNGDPSVYIDAVITFVNDLTVTSITLNPDTMSMTNLANPIAVADALREMDFAVMANGEVLTSNINDVTVTIEQAGSWGSYDPVDAINAPGTYYISVSYAQNETYTDSSASRVALTVTDGRLAPTVLTVDGVVMIGYHGAPIPKEDVLAEVFKQVSVTYEGTDVGAALSNMSINETWVVLGTVWANKWSDLGDGGYNIPQTTPIGGDVLGIYSPDALGKYRMTIKFNGNNEYGASNELAVEFEVYDNRGDSAITASNATVDLYQNGQKLTYTEAMTLEALKPVITDKETGVAIEGATAVITYIKEANALVAQYSHVGIGDLGGNVGTKDITAPGVYTIRLYFEGNSEYKGSNEAEVILTVEDNRGGFSVKNSAVELSFSETGMLEALKTAIDATPDYANFSVSSDAALVEQARVNPTGITVTVSHAGDGYYKSGSAEVTVTFTGVYYDVPVNGNGTVNSGSSVVRVNYGDEATFTIDESEGHTYELTVSNGTLTKNEDGSYTLSGVNNNTALTATVTVNTHTVTWTVNGEEYTTTEVDYGTEFTAPEYTIPEGHTFSGWTVPETMPDEDITLDATLTVNQYPVTWKWMTAEGEQTSTADQNYGTPIDAPEIPAYYEVEENGENVRYYFTGWEGLTDGATVPVGGVTYTATYEATTVYTVDFDANGGTSVRDQYIEENEKVSEPATTREGYRFDGWYTEAGDLYDFTTPVTADIKLTAKWVKLVTVTFEGAGEIDPQTFDINGKATEPTAPVKDKAIFGGWYLNDEEFNFDIVVTEDITLTAKWHDDVNENEVPDENETITVVINGTGASVTINNEDVTAYVYDSVNGGAVTIVATPVITGGNSVSYVSSIVVDGGENVIVPEGYNNYAYTYSFEANGSQTVTVTFTDCGFVLDEDGEMRFYVGMELPDKETMYNSVITNPAYSENVLSVEYLARPAGTYSIEIPVLFEFTIPLINYPIKLGGDSYDVELEAAWLDVGEEFKVLTPEQLQAQYDAEIQKIRDKIAAIDLSDISWDNVLSKVQQLLAIGEEITNLVTIITNEAQYLGYHQFGANANPETNATEILKVVYENEAMHLEEEGIVVTLIDDRTPVYLDGGNLTFEYDEYTDDTIIDAITLTDAQGNVVNGNIYKAGTLAGKDVGEYTYTVHFDGNENYKPADATFTLTVIKAPSNVDVPNLNVTYGDNYSAAPVFTNQHGEPITVDNIQFVVGLDANELGVGEDGVSGLVARVQLMLPKNIQDVLSMIGLKEGMTLSTEQLSDYLESAAGALESLGMTQEVVDLLVGALDSISNITNVISLEITIGGEYPSDIGVYLMGAVATDPNYETSFDVGYMIIKTNGQRVYLKHDYEDANGIFTWELLQHDVLGASAYTDETYTTVHDVADAMVQTLFFGIDENGELVVETNGANLGNGAYTQLSFVVEFGNDTYYAVPIVRAFAIVPNVLDVELVDDTGAAQDTYSYTFDNTAKELYVTVNGERVEAEVTYVGLQTNIETYNSTEAPKHAGVYAAIVTYVAKNGDEVTAVGADVAIITIEPAESSITVEDVIVEYNGEHRNLAELLQIQIESATSNVTPDTTIITASIASTGDFSENGWEAVNSVVNIDFPKWVDNIIAEYAPSVLDGITLGELDDKIINKLPDISAELAELGISAEVVNALTGAVKGVADILAELPEGIDLTFKDTDTLTAKSIGAYLVVGVVTDSDHYPAADYGILVIVPEVSVVDLKWNHEDDNSIWTRELLKQYDLYASAFNTETGDLDAEATAQITHQFITVDRNGDLVIYNSQDDLTNGVYIELAYIEFEFAGEMVLSDLIARSVVIVTSPAEVIFVDENGNENNDRIFTFDNTGKGMDVQVSVNGNVITPGEGDLVVTYTGVQTNGKTYNSTVAPTHAGVYIVTAAYNEYDDNGNLLVYGSAVGAMAIKPAESAITVEDKIVHVAPGVYHDPEDQITIDTAVSGQTPDSTIIVAGIGSDGTFSENGWEAIGGTVNVDFPRWIDELIAQYAPSVIDGITVSEFGNKLVSKLPNIADKLAELGATNEIINSMSNAITNVSKLLAKMPENVTLSFKDDVVISEVGAYVIAAVVSDSDYISDADYGILVITPDVEHVHLKWNHEDSNNIWTPVLLQNPAVDLYASAYDDKDYTILNEGATAQIVHQFLSVDAKGNLVVYTSADELGNGIYTELAYIAFEVDGHMYISDMIARTVIIVPNTADVTFVDHTGAENNDRIFTFDNTEKEMDVKITIAGEVVTPGEGDLKVIYTGVQTNGKTYNSTTAPTHAGAYVVTATYSDYDANGNLLAYGAAVGALVIEPADSAISVTGGTVEYDGNGHTADVVAAGSGVTEPDYTLISGGAYVSGDIDEIGVDAFHGNVNIDFPRWLDEALAEYEFVTEGVDTAYLIDFITSYRDTLDKLIPVDELVAVLDKLPKDVALTFNNDVTYTEPGYYFFYGIVTDSDHYPSSDTGLLVIEKKDITFDLVDTTVAWDGEGHMVTVNNPNNADFTTVIIDRENNTINILIDEDAQYLLNTVARILGVDFDGDVQMSTIIEKYNGKELAAAIVELIGELEKLDLSEEILKALAAVKTELETLPEVGTVTVNGALPTELGTYEVYAISYSEYYKTVSSEAVLEIVPAEITSVEVTSTHTYDGTEQTATVVVKSGDTILVEGVDYKIVSGNTGTNAGDYTVTVEGIGHYAGTESADWTIVPAAITVTIQDAEKYYGDDDPANLTYEITEGKLMGNDSLTVTYTREDGKDVGTYAITATVAEDPNYTITVVNEAELTIKPAYIIYDIADMTITVADDLPTREELLSLLTEVETAGKITPEELANMEIYTTATAVRPGVYDIHITANPSTNAEGVANYNISVYSGNLIIELGDYICWNVDTETYYDDVTDALDAATGTGATIQMLADATDAVNDKDEVIVIVHFGLTFDLNGYYVETDHMLSYGDVIDTNKDSGGIVIDDDTSKAFTQLQPGNTYLPIYDTANGCYRFFQYGLQRVSTQTTTSASGTAVKFSFRLKFYDGDAYGLLAKGNTGVKMQVKLFWDGLLNEIIYTMDVKTLTDYAADAYAEVQSGDDPYAGINATMYLVVGGVDRMSAGDVMTANPTVVTVTDVERATADMTYTVK